MQFIFYKPPNFRQLHGGRTVKQELKRVDYVGIFLLVSGMSMFLLGISWGESCFVQDFLPNNIC